MTKSYAAKRVHSAAPRQCGFSLYRGLFKPLCIPTVHAHNFPAWALTALALFKAPPSPYIGPQSNNIGVCAQGSCLLHASS